jgi:TniQ
VHAVQIADPAWETTFPHRVAPRPEEWLAGVLLRSDEANGWDSGTTASFLFRETQTKNALSAEGFVIPSSFSLAPLAGWLAVSEDVLCRTTYLFELARLYDMPVAHTGLLSRDVLFHFCPVCVAESRMLRRTLTLPHLQSCLIHHVALSSRCECGNNLTVEQLVGSDGLSNTEYELFHMLASLSAGTRQKVFSLGRQPFTCHRCRRDWSTFPRPQADPKRIALEERILAWYEFFFSHGSRSLLARALQLIQQKIAERKVKSVKRLDGKSVLVNFPSPEKSSLARVVDILVSLDMCPADIEADDSPLLWRSIDWQTFYCPVLTCPYMKPRNLTAEPSGHQVGSFPSEDETTHAPGADS